MARIGLRGRMPSMPDHYQRIRREYESLQGDSVELFRVVLSASAEIGMGAALATLEQCVIEKRSAWLSANLVEAGQGKDPLLDGYVWFYEKYLGLSVPKDGAIVGRSGSRIVMRWWNPCPTLEACVQLGLDTREICKQAYHKPVQTFLEQVHPGLRFGRNYERLRPYGAYCEEFIELVA
jgi:hypothetical protein